MHLMGNSSVTWTFINILITKHVRALQVQHQITLQTWAFSEHCNKHNRNKLTASEGAIDDNDKNNGRVSWP